MKLCVKYHTTDVFNFLLFVGLHVQITVNHGNLCLNLSNINSCLFRLVDSQFLVSAIFGISIAWLILGDFFVQIGLFYFNMIFFL